jgi:hypothetical protein
MNLSKLANIKTKIDSNWTGWTLLAVSFCIGCLTIYWGEFVDEADNLVVGSLISRGHVLYRDIFSHHFPFPYYWTAVVVNFFGKSIFLARLSVWLFQVVSFGIAIKLSRYHLSLGLAALIWSILRPLYRGNLVLYSSFAGASLVVVFALTLAILQQRINGTWKHSLAIGFFSTISILSDPLSVYAVVISLACLLTKDLKRGTIASFFVVIGLFCYTGFLVASGTFKDFLIDAIFFNSQIYAKYNYTNPLRIREFWDMVITGLEITDKDWLSFNPFKPINTEYTQFDRWFFSGFLYRLAIVTSTIFLTLRKQFRSAIFLYLFASAILIINKWDFRGQPFVIVSLIAVSAVITREWWYVERNKVIKTSQVAVGLLVGFMVIWLNVRTITHFFVNRNALLYETHFAGYETEAARIRELSCNQSNVKLAYYPGGTYFYWFTDMAPVSNYVFMWPWVAEVGLSDVIKELSQKQVLAIVARKDSLIWGQYDTKKYLRPLDEYLENNYVRLPTRGSSRFADVLYISPELSVQCREVQK